MKTRKASRNKKIFSFIVSVIMLIYVVIVNSGVSFSIPELDIILKELGSSNVNISEEHDFDENIDTPVVSIQEDNLKVYYLDVGQADSILIDIDGKYVLIDAGNNEDGKKLVTYFDSLGIESFEYVIGTHAHEDHIGGMDDIIDNFVIGTFYMPDVLTTTKTFEDVLDSLESNEVVFDIPEVLDVFEVGKAKFEVQYLGDDADDLNSTSIVIKMTYGEKSFLFTGDMTEEVEELMLEDNIDVSAHVLKVSHHGSPYSSTEDFLDEVNPEIAVISVGEGNSYKHPGEVVLNRLEERNVEIYRTDLDNTIVISYDGKGLAIEKIETDTNG